MFRSLENLFHDLIHSAEVHSATRSKSPSHRTSAEEVRLLTAVSLGYCTYCSNLGPKSIVQFHNDFTPIGEQSEQRKSAHTL